MCIFSVASLLNKCFEWAWGFSTLVGCLWRCGGLLEGFLLWGFVGFWGGGAGDVPRVWLRGITLVAEDPLPPISRRFTVILAGTSLGEAQLCTLPSIAPSLCSLPYGRCPRPPVVPCPLVLGTTELGRPAPVGRAVFIEVILLMWLTYSGTNCLFYCFRTQKVYFVGCCCFLQCNVDSIDPWGLSGYPLAHCLPLYPT